MKLIEEQYIRNNQVKFTEKVEYLIMSVGTSYEPLVLNIRLMKPKRVLFLYTEKTRKILDQIVRYCGLDISDIEMERVSEVNPLDIYREIKHAYLNWDRPSKLYIDFTGGTKSMSAAAAMAGSMINVQLVYVGSTNYLQDFRKPEPGSETLFFIANPLTVFGDMEIEKAFTLFSQNHYSGAAEKLEVLMEQVPDPGLRQQLQFTYLLARTYESWDALEFTEAHEQMVSLIRQLDRDSAIHRTYILMDCIPRLKCQEKILNALKDLSLQDKNNQMALFANQEGMAALMFTLYQNALVREKQEKYDMATLLLYRLLEMMEQKRLANMGLDVSDLDYDRIPYENCGLPQVAALPPEERREWLRLELVRIRKALFRKVGTVSLPVKVSLLDGYSILLALSDPFCTGGVPAGEAKLKRIRAMVTLRNNSVFAHGFGPVGAAEFSRFKEFVVTAFREFCILEQIPFAEAEDAIRWLDPAESVNFNLMEL